MGLGRRVIIVCFVSCCSLLLGFIVASWCDVLFVFHVCQAYREIRKIIQSSSDGGRTQWEFCGVQVCQYAFRTLYGLGGLFL